jgi:hypothetical protein
MCGVSSRGQSFAQIEAFEFRRPRVRRLPAGHRLCDFGYSIIGVHLPRFDDGLDRIAPVGGELLTKPLGEPGGRRVCLRDPDGILLELMEDPRLSAPGERADGQQRNLPSIANVTVAVRDLDLVRAV